MFASGEKTADPLAAHLLLRDKGFYGFEELLARDLSAVELEIFQRILLPIEVAEDSVAELLEVHGPALILLRLLFPLSLGLF